MLLCNSHQGNEWHRKSQNLNITLKPSELSIIPVSIYMFDLVWTYISAITLKKLDIL